jgi:hypothetical protein
MVRRFGLVAIALGLVGCSNPFATDGQSDVALIMGGINGGVPLTSNVTTASPDSAIVVLGARSKNIRFNTTQYTRGIQLQRYEVRFYRSDGRNTEGVDVPYSIAGNISAFVDIGDPEKNVALPVEIVRAQAKIEPPLRNMRGVVGGQAQVFTCFAEVTIYGNQLASGDIVQSVGNVQIDFTGVVN